MSIITIHEHDESKAYDLAAMQLQDCIQDCLSAERNCTIGIVGGRATPKIFAILLERLKTQDSKGNIDLFWLDERADLDKNYPPTNDLIKGFKSEKLTIRSHNLVATEKEELLKQSIFALEELKELKKTRGSDDLFDIVMLSSGEDGHIASLFPNKSSLDHEGEEYIFIDDSPKPPKTRVSATIHLITSTRNAILLFIGDKADAYSLFTNQNLTEKECPAKAVLKIDKVAVITALSKNQKR